MQNRKKGFNYSLNEMYKRTEIIRECDLDQEEHADLKLEVLCLENVLENYLRRNEDQRQR